MVELANEFAPFVQIDIMDGLFVPTRSIGAADLQGLDMRFKWEAHLMVANPLRQLEAFKEAGATRAIFHIESQDDAGRIVSEARSLGIGIGVAINPCTAVADVAPFLPEVDVVLLMAVYPGYYGEPFVPEVMLKVSRVRAACPQVEIGVDGGIKESNLMEVVRHDVDTVCVGSAIFNSGDAAASYLRLTRLAQEG